MKAPLLFLTAVGVAIPLHAAEQTTTNHVSDDTFVAAVFKTARPAKTVLEPVRTLPATRILFSHSTSLRRYQTKDEKVKAGSSASTATRIVAKSATANTNIVSATPAVRQPQPTYELAPMTTEQLAERRAIFGWRIQRKK